MDKQKQLQPLSSNNAILILTNHFLGDHWCVADPLSQEQVNAIIVDDMLRKYPQGKFRRIHKNGGF